MQLNKVISGNDGCDHDNKSRRFDGSWEEPLRFVWPATAPFSKRSQRGQGQGPESAGH